MIIAVANTKGGVGKTTSAVMLAAAAVRAGYPAQVLDADPQGSASTWARLAENGGETFPFSVLPANIPTINALIDDSMFTIIDTPPGMADVIQASVNKADFVVIPTLPASSDMLRTGQTLAATAGKAAAVLLISVEENTNAYRAAKEVLKDGYPHFDTVIPKRQSLRDLYGSPPARSLYRYDSVLIEIMEAIQ